MLEATRDRPENAQRPPDRPRTDQNRENGQLGVQGGVNAPGAAYERLSAISGKLAAVVAE